MQAPLGETMLEDDTLVSALGGGIDLDVVPGVREHVDSLNTPETAVRIARKLQETPGTRVVVCGGRLTGLEAATEIADSHPETKVTLVTAGQLGDWRSPAAQDYVRKAMQELGVEVHEHAKVTRVDADAIDTDAGVIDPFDLCVWAGGFTVPGLAADAGLKVDDQRRVLTDTTLRSVADPPIYRVSDVAAVPGPWGCSLAMGCRTGGFIGSVAADNIVARLSGGKPRGFSSGTSTSASASAGSDT